MATQSLTVHIGLPKTMTTTLQQHLFPRIPGYIGRYYGPRGNTTDRDEFWHHAVSAWRNGDKAWKRGLESVASQIASLDARSALLSHEALSQWFTPGRIDPWPFKDGDILRQRGPHPVGDFLSVLDHGLGPSVVLRVIVTLRNQPDFMASLYAQNAAWNRSFGQTDFVQRVDEIVAAQDAFFRWNELVDCLDDIVKTEDPLVLFHEDGLQTNMARIAAFLGFPSIKVDNDSLIENRRKNHTGSWDSSIEHVSMSQIVRLAVEPRYRPKGTRQSAQQAERLQPSPRAVARVLALVQQNRQRRRSIRLPLDLAEGVRAAYSIGNRRLEVRTRRSLSSLGY